MSDDTLNCEMWVSIGQTNRGKSKAEKITIRRLIRMFDKPSVDNSITYAEYMKLGESKEGKRPNAIFVGW